MTANKKTKKSESKVSTKKLVEEKLTNALDDIKHLWTEKKFLSKIKKAAKHFADGKEPKIKVVKIKKKKAEKITVEQ